MIAAHQLWPVSDSFVMNDEYNYEREMHCIINSCLVGAFEGDLDF